MAIHAGWSKAAGDRVDRQLRPPDAVRKDPKIYYSCWLRCVRPSVRYSRCAARIGAHAKPPRSPPPAHAVRAPPQKLDVTRASQEQVQEALLRFLQSVKYQPAMDM